MAPMAKEVAAKYKSESESNQQDSEDEVMTLLVEKLCNIITCLTNKLAKSKEWIRSLFKEVKDHKEETNSCSSLDSIQEEPSIRVQKLEEENSLLNGQIEELKSKLEMFTLGSKYLNMILGSQPAMFNKFELGYKSNISHRSYISLVNRQIDSNKIVKAWIPKSCLINQIGHNKYGIPKQLHYVNLERKSQNYDLGGARKNLFHNHIK